MRFVVLVAGLLVISGAFTYGYLRSSRRNAEAELQEFAETVPAPLTAEVRQWLAPQLARRTVYPALGAMWGLMAGNIPWTPGWDELPWYWFAVLVGSGIGFTAGALVAGYRTAPLLDGSVRMVDPVRRRVSEYYDRSHLLTLRLAVVVSVTGVGLAGTIATSSDTASTRRALVGCAIAVLVVAAHYWVAATVISRPMVASTPEGLLWQKALLAKTVEPMPSSAFLVAIFSAAVALFVTVLEYRDLPLPVLLFSACFTLLAAASAAAVLLSVTRNGQWSLTRAPSERTAP